MAVYEQYQELQTIEEHPEIDMVDLKAHATNNRLRGFWNLIVGYHWHYVGAIAFLAIGAVLNTLGMVLIGHFVDEVLGQDLPNFDRVLVGTAALYIGLILMRGGFTFLSGRLAAQTAEGMARRLKNYMYDHIQRLSFTFHDNSQTGDLIQRVTSDIDAIRRFFADQFIGAGRIAALFTVNFIAILLINWQLAILSIVVIPVVLIISTYFFRRVFKAWDKFQAQEARLSTALQENLSGVRVVKAFAQQEYEIEKFEKENKEKYRQGRNFTLMHTTYWPILDIITGIQLLVGYFVGAMMAINGTITVGQYVQYAQMVIWIIFPMRNMGRLIVQMSTGLASYDRIIEIITEDRVQLGKQDAPPVNTVDGNVRFDHVDFHYEGNPEILHDISFEVKAGQTVALLGSTGSGKTSLVGLIPRFYDYSSGSITLDGVELREFPRYFLRENIGVVEQEPFLFSRTIRENIAYSVSRKVDDDEIIAAAKAAAIHDRIMEFPDGYDTMVGERGVTLSGGQKQRVALARTLLKNPKILILDDATSSVDTETESAIREALNNLMTERTSFIIAHRIQSVMTADLILVMDKGRIVQRGTHTDLMQEEGGIYRRIYDMQARVEEELEQELAS